MNVRELCTRDVVSAQESASVEEIAGMPAFSIMTRDPLVLREDTSFNDALDGMAVRGVRRDSHRN